MLALVSLITVRTVDSQTIKLVYGIHSLTPAVLLPSLFKKQNFQPRSWFSLSPQLYIDLWFHLQGQWCSL